MTSRESGTAAGAAGTAGASVVAAGSRSMVMRPEPASACDAVRRVARPGGDYHGVGRVAGCQSNEKRLRRQRWQRQVENVGLELHHQPSRLRRHAGFGVRRHLEGHGDVGAAGVHPRHDAGHTHVADNQQPRAAAQVEPGIKDE